MDFNSGFVQIIGAKRSPTQATRHGINPANLKTLPEVPVATQSDLDQAAAAGKEAFKSWSRVPYEERRTAVLGYADAIAKYRTNFRDLLTTEQGKPVSLFFITELRQTLTNSASTSRCRNGGSYRMDPWDGQHFSPRGCD